MTDHRSGIGTVPVMLVMAIVIMALFAIVAQHVSWGWSLGLIAVGIIIAAVLIVWPGK